MSFRTVAEFEEYLKSLRKTVKGQGEDLYKAAVSLKIEQKKLADDKFKKVLDGIQDVRKEMLMIEQRIRRAKKANLKSLNKLIAETDKG